MNLIKSFLLLLALVTTSWAQTLGGTPIPNQAVATYEFLGLSQPPEASNIVTSLVPSMCALRITPDGSVAVPAYQTSSFAGATVYFPYIFTNTGNALQDYTLVTRVETSSTVLPGQVNLILDSNNNQQADTGESVITSLNALAPGQRVSLLLEVILAQDITLTGDVYINVMGSCSNDPGITDNDNISQITVLEGGMANLEKTSVPASGSFVVAGDRITYTVSFRVNQNQLSNVVISDQLDENLGTPSSRVLTVNGVERGTTAFDVLSRSVTGTLATLEPNDVVALTITTTVQEDVLGGITIPNQATLDFDGAPTQQTNTVTHTTVSTCGLVITPDGTTTSPAQQQNAVPGQIVVFPYVIANIGNISATYDLDVETLTQSSVRPDSVGLFEDANGNGQLDAGESEVSSLRLDPDAQARLLVALTLPGNSQTTGEVFINLIGVCRGDTNTRDDNNVSQATIPLGGFASPQKSADPVTGTMLYPGFDLNYFITFTANGRELTNVVVSDVLSEFLEVPSSFSQGTVTDTRTGLSTTVAGRYDASTRSVIWNIASVPANMTVTLAIVTRVRADLTSILANTVIENRALVKSDDNPETFTNTTVHPLSPIAILLRKVANPERVVVGETLFYTLEVINPDEGLDLQRLELSDNLPEVLSYQPDTSVITFPDGSEQRIEPEISGQVLTWDLPGLKAGERLSVLFATTVLPSALDIEDIVNTAQVVASDVNGRAVADAAASVGTVVMEGALDAKAVLMGTVFIDNDLDGVFDQNTDRPVENVRLYLSDGHSVLTDALGRYTFLELEAGIESLKVDTTTLPARLFEKTSDEVKSGLWRVQLEAGLMTRQDVPLLPAKGLLSIGQSLNVSMGPVKIHKFVVATGEAYEVILDISSSQALNNLIVTDALPDHAALAGVVVSTQAITTEGLQFDLGNVPAGYTVTIRYPITLRGDKQDVLLAPVMHWDVRP